MRTIFCVSRDDKNCVICWSRTVKRENSLAIFSTAAEGDESVSHSESSLPKLEKETTTKKSTLFSVVSKKIIVHKFQNLLGDLRSHVHSRLKRDFRLMIKICDLLEPTSSPESCQKKKNCPKVFCSGSWLGDFTEGSVSDSPLL